MTNNVEIVRKQRGIQSRRQRYSIGAQLTATEHAQLQETCALRGCTPSELVRGALQLTATPPVRPLLVTAGQLIRAGNAHAAAARAGNWQAASIKVRELDRLARELIRLAVVEIDDDH